MGPSGSGKSTLLHLIAGMDKPTQGRLIALGEEPARMSERELARWRNNHLGFVFQAFNLIPVMTAVENVELPLKLTRLSRRQRRGEAENGAEPGGGGGRAGPFSPAPLGGAGD